MALAKWFLQICLWYKEIGDECWIPFFENTQMVTAEITTGATVIWVCLKSQNKERAVEMLRQPAHVWREFFWSFQSCGGNIEKCLFRLPQLLVVTVSSPWIDAIVCQDIWNTCQCSAGRMPNCLSWVDEPNERMILWPNENDPETFAFARAALYASAATADGLPKVVQNATGFCWVV